MQFPRLGHSRRLTNRIRQCYSFDGRAGIQVTLRAKARVNSRQSAPVHGPVQAKSNLLTLPSIVCFGLKPLEYPRQSPDSSEKNSSFGEFGDKLPSRPSVPSKDSYRRRPPAPRGLGR